MALEVRASLFNLQLLLAATKLFNHLCERNERRRFLAEPDYQWQNISPSDITVVGEGDAVEVSSSFPDFIQYLGCLYNFFNYFLQQVPGPEDSSLDGFRFPNPNTKFVLTTIPQVVSFRKRVEIFQVG
jgi:hypothetical protein